MSTVSDPTTAAHTTRAVSSRQQHDHGMPTPFGTLALSAGSVRGFNDSSRALFQMNDAPSNQRHYVHVPVGGDRPVITDVTSPIDPARASVSTAYAAGGATSTVSQANATACPPPAMMFGSQLVPERSGLANVRLASAMTQGQPRPAGSTASPSDSINVQAAAAAALIRERVHGASSTRSLETSAAYQVIHGHFNVANTSLVGSGSTTGATFAPGTRGYSYNPASSVRSIVAGAASVLGFQLGSGSWTSPSAPPPSQPDSRPSAIRPGGTGMYGGGATRNGSQRGFSAYREEIEENARAIGERGLRDERNREAQRMPHQFRTKAVCRLECTHCRRVVCMRGMKAMLLADTRIELFSTDSPPMSVELVGDDYMTRNCRCRIKDVACIGCGEVCGYHITAPCARCMDACNNGHFWMFHTEGVRSSERLDETGNKTLLWASLPIVEQDVNLCDVYSMMCR